MENLFIEKNNLKGIIFHNTYMLLSFCYLTLPNKEFIEKINSKEFIKILNSLEIFQIKEINYYKNLIIKYLEKSKNLSNKFLNELKEEYTRIFRGIKKEEILPPYESIYKEKRYFGISTFQVERIYKDFGLKITKKYEGEPADYIGFELSFLGILSLKESSFWKEKKFKELINLLKIKANFIFEHIIIWFNKFCEKITEKKISTFYLGIIFLTKEIVKLDYNNTKQNLNFLINLNSY